MAKSRKRTKSSRASIKRVKRARPKKRARKAPLRPKQIELGPIRVRLKKNVEVLGTAISRSADPQPELEEALKRMSRWLDDIGAICGSQMMIPIP